MKNVLKKLHIMSDQSGNKSGSTSLERNKSSHGSSSSIKRLLSFKSPQSSEKKPFSGLSSLFHSVANRKNPSALSLNQGKVERMEPSDTVSSGGLNVVSDSARGDLECSASKDHEVDEEYQLQLALELSAKEDPEAVQIEAVKQISLGSCDPENTPAEVVAYRYWVSYFVHFKHIDIRLRSLSCLMMGLLEVNIKIFEVWNLEDINFKFDYRVILREKMSL